jgi:hypothetical protein
MPEASVFSATPDPAPITPIASPPVELQLQAEPGLETPPTGPLLLGTDKRNPVFAVDEGDPAELVRVSSSLPSPQAGVGLAAQQWAEVPQQTRESGMKSWEEAHADKAPGSAGQPPVEPGTPSGNNADPTPFFPKDPAESLYWCDHAGVLVFATALAAISQVSPRPQRILAPWMAALLLGAQNIEQTKYLNWEDLELILGGVVRFPTPQRDQLKALAADPGLLDDLWRFNQTNLGPEVGSDFYFDSHTNRFYQALPPFKKAYHNYRDDHDYFRKLTQSPRSHGSASARNSDPPDATNPRRRRVEERGPPSAGGDEGPGAGASVSAGKKMEVPPRATSRTGIADERGGGLKPQAESVHRLAATVGIPQRLRDEWNSQVLVVPLDQDHEFLHAVVSGSHAHDFNHIPCFQRRLVLEWRFNEVKPDCLHQFHCRKFQDQHYRRRLGARWF